MLDTFLSCGGAARTPAASYRVTVDRPVTVAGAKGRYVEATFTCPDGSSRQMRRWHLPSLQVLIDSAGRNADVDEAVRTLRPDR
jgi:hypothetical protein